MPLLCQGDWSRRGVHEHIRNQNNVLSPSDSHALVAHVCPPRFAAELNAGRQVEAPEQWLQIPQLPQPCLLCTCAQQGCKHTQTHRRYSLPTLIALANYRLQQNKKD